MAKKGQKFITIDEQIILKIVEEKIKNLDIYNLFFHQ